MTQVVCIIKLDNKLKLNNFRMWGWELNFDRASVQKMPILEQGPGNWAEVGDGCDRAWDQETMFSQSHKAVNIRGH